MTEKVLEEQQAEGTQLAYQAGEMLFRLLTAALTIIWTM